MMLDNLTASHGITNHFCTQFVGRFGSAHDSHLINTKDVELMDDKATKNLNKVNQR